MRVFFLAAFLVIFVQCENLNIDKFLATLGKGSIGLNRTQVIEVFMNESDKLNVTAESHVNACTDFIEQFNLVASLHGKQVYQMQNMSTVGKVFEFIHNSYEYENAYPSRFTQNLTDIIVRTGNETDINDFMKKTCKSLREAYGSIWNDWGEQGFDYGDVIHRLKSGVHSSYSFLTDDTREKIEKRFCSSTLINIFQQHPLLITLKSEFESADPLYLTEYNRSYTNLGLHKIKITEAIEIFNEESARLSVPTQSHIDACYDSLLQTLNLNYHYIDIELKPFNMFNLEGEMQLNSTYDIATEFEAKLRFLSIPYKILKFNFGKIAKHFPTFSQEQRMFFNKMYEIFLDAVIDIANNEVGNLSTGRVLEVMKDKVAMEFRKLSIQERFILERKFCILTTLRIHFSQDEEKQKFIKSFYSTA